MDIHCAICTWNNLISKSLTMLLARHWIWICTVSLTFYRLTCFPWHLCFSWVILLNFVINGRWRVYSWALKCYAMWNLHIWWICESSWGAIWRHSFFIDDQMSLFLCLSVNVALHLKDPYLLPWSRYLQLNPRPSFVKDLVHISNTVYFFVSAM